MTSSLLQDCVTIEGPNTVVLTAPRNCHSNRQSDKSLPQTAQRFTFTQVAVTSPVCLSNGDITCLSFNRVLCCAGL